MPTILGDRATPIATELSLGGAEGREAGSGPSDCGSCFRLLAVLTGQAVYDRDLGSGRVCWGGAVVQVTGWTPEELQGGSAPRWPEMVHPDDRSSVVDAVTRARQEMRPYAMEYRLLRKDGSYVHVEDRGTFFPGPSGRAARVLGSLLDVSRRWELEQQLGQAQKMEAVGQLAGGVAHDFNNIVSIIMCYAEQALRQCGPEAPASRALQQILRASSRAAELTRQLLVFSRKGATCPAVVNLDDIIKSSQGMLRRLISEDVALVVELGPGLDDVVADAGQIEQVLMNLAANARDAMPGGGTLTITTANVELEHDSEAHSRTRRRVLLRVRDTGCGMPPEVLRHIFEPFFTTKPVGQGTGLGLATVAGVIQQSGGAIDVESAVGAGTTFSIFFPAVARKDDAVAKETRPARVGGSETILLVEDDAALLRILQEGLMHQGYTVLAAQSGQGALDLALQHKGAIDLVITDMIMPGMSGYELVSQLLLDRPSLRVLYISGYTADFMARRGLAVDGTELLSKPFADETLQARIRTLLDGQ
jgi:two-component system cell cycle sensor histidine kinase/response regulator CckA